MSKTAKRSSLIAGLLAIITVGLGHMYCARFARGLTYLIIFVAIYLLGQELHLFASYKGTLLCFGLMALVYVIQFLGAICLAFRSRGTVLKLYNHWFFYLVYLAAAAGIAYGVNYYFFRYQFFYVGTMSMAPALNQGEIVVTSTDFNYDRGTARNNIITFNLADAPRGKKNIPDASYVKRIIAVDGDVVEQNYGKIYVNGEELTEDYLADAPMKESREVSRIEVPDNTVYILGDNRDNSYDSRDFGPIPIAAIQGKVLFIIWSNDPVRIGKKLK